MKEKGIKAEDVKNLPPIEEIHGLDIPTQVVEVNYLYRFDEGDIPYNKSASQYLDEFDNYIVKQEHFNRYVSNQLKRNAIMIDHLSDLMFRIANDVKGLGKHASMVQTQLEQVAKAQNDLLNEMNNKMNGHAVRVMTRGGRMTQEPLYPEGHPKRIEQDSHRINNDVPSPSKKKKKKENDRTLHTSSEPEVEKPSEDNHDVSISDAETQSGNEHSPDDNNNDDAHVDAQPDNDKEPDNDVEIEPTVDLDNPPPKNKRYDKRDFVARKHGKERTMGSKTPALSS
jgi:archaellum component FlaC